MSSLASSQPISTQQRIAPFVADGIAILLYLATAGWLVERFSRNALNFTALLDAGILLVSHIVFLIGIARLRRVGGPPSYKLVENKPLTAVLCVIYAVAFVFSVADLTGYLDTLFTVDFGDMGNAYYFLVTPAVYLMIGLLYLFLLRQPVDTADTEASGLVPLVLTNVMLVAAAAFLQAFMRGNFEGQAPLVTAVISYAVLTLLFLLPRAIYSARTRNWLGILSFDLLIIALVAIPLLFS